MHKTIHDKVQSIRAEWIKSGKDMSFTTALNMVLLGGIIGSSNFTQGNWSDISDFLENEDSKLNLLSLKDQFADVLLEREIKRGRFRK